MRPFSKVALLLAVVVVAPALAQTPDDAAETPELTAKRQFYTQVRPLLATYCWSCHGPNKQEGGLRLDSREGFQAGGFSKQNLLETNFENNELLRRLQALDPHERMPLGRAPLSEADRGILESWLKQGAVWADAPAKPPPGQPLPPPPKPWHERLWNAFEVALDYDSRYLYPVFYAAIACFLVILGLEWAYERAKRGGVAEAEMRGVAGLAAHLRPYAYLVVLLALFMAGWHLHTQRSFEQISQRLAALEKIPKPTDPVVPVPASPPPMSGETATARPIYLKSKAPFKFGGTYYRGNDERNDQLYNGGYYRTATLKLALCNAEREEIKLGDELPAEGLQIRIIIIRGRNAVPTLFSRQMMSRTILTLTPPTSSTGGGVFPGENFLEEIRTGEEWHGYAPLPAAGPFAGDAYLVTGNFDGNQQFTGNAHFLVHYDLKRQEGRLAPDSELWLAATLFPGNMVWTQKHQIAANEWFDFLPIPEIEGPNATDPALLGVPEHEKKLGEKLEADKSAQLPKDSSPNSPRPVARDPFNP